MSTSPLEREHPADVPRPIKLPERPRILVVKQWAIGDILLATPLLHALKRGYPGSRISWLVDTRYASILDGNELIDEVIAFDSPLWRRHFRYGNIPAYLTMSTGLRRRLNAGRFDAVINLTGEKWWSIWFNAAPVRIGLFPRRNPGAMGRLYTRAIPRTFDPILHNTDHYLLPANALGIPEPYDRRMSVPRRDEDSRAVRGFLESQEGYHAGRPIIVLHPGTSQASKCWPTSHFGALVDRLSGEFNVVITGSAIEIDLANQIVDSLQPGTTRPIIAAGALTDLRHVLALIDQAAAVVTGDTSILHFASAVETPLIGIYGSTRPGLNAPYFGEHAYFFNDDLECSPCSRANCPLEGVSFMKCMRTINPGDVHLALLNLMNTSEREPVVD